MMDWVIPFLIGMVVGGFLVAYVFILRFRAGTHKTVMMILNGMDKLLTPKKKEDPKKNGKAK